MLSELEKTPVIKATKKRKTDDDSIITCVDATEAADFNDSRILAEETHLLYTPAKYVKWWIPVEPSTTGGIDPRCYCGQECKKETNQWSGVKEILCKKPMKQKCGFKMTCHAFIRFHDLMLKPFGLKAFPLPSCSCSLVDSKNVVLRGSNPNVENPSLWFTCTNCDTRYNFKDQEAKILKICNVKANSKKTLPKIDEEDEVVKPTTSKPATKDVIDSDAETTGDEDDESDSDDDNVSQTSHLSQLSEQGIQQLLAAAVQQLPKETVGGKKKKGKKNGEPMQE
ncbi:TPA_asm: hypothetical protein [Anelosimus tangle-web spider MELD virus]|nr:TPA_asm: hypothetical protein [Anelosimus tangle-web spider MELD virus]